MKRIFLISIFAAAISAASYGQMKLSLGPVLGLNYNFYNGTAVEALNARVTGIGFNVGGIVDMQFNSIVGMTAQVTVYDCLDAAAKQVQSGVKRTRELNVRYIMINPSLKIMVTKTGLGFVLGPGIGFNLKADWQQYMVGNGQRVQEQDRTQFTQVITPRVEIHVGMFYDFYLKGVTLTPYFNFDYALNNISEMVEMKAHDVDFGVQLKFPIKK